MAAREEYIAALGNTNRSLMDPVEVLASLSQATSSLEIGDIRFADSLATKSMKLSKFCADIQIEAWAVSVPPSWRYKNIAIRPEIREMSFASGVYGQHYHIYEDLYLCHIWNNWRAIRLVIHEIILNSASQIEGQNLEYDDPMNMINYAEIVTRSENIMQQFQTDIFASVPYHFGATDDFTASTGNTAAGFSDITPMAGHILMWPLFLAADCRYSPPALRDWVIMCLRKIVHQLGVNQALGMALMLQKGISSRAWTQSDSASDMASIGSWETSSHQSQTDINALFLSGASPPKFAGFCHADWPLIQITRSYGHAQLMKLIVAGSTGFVGSEVIRQAVSIPSITSIVALARRPTPVPQNAGPRADVSKLKSAVCEDFENYPESLRQELAGADACIWLVAVTPSKSKEMPFERARKICSDFTIAGLKIMTPISNKPFRFIYTSGAKTEQDPAKKPWILGDYCLMRGQVESLVLDYAKQSEDAVQACVTKPGLINAPGRLGLAMSFATTIGRTLIGLPKVEVTEIAATLLDQAVNGIEKEILLNEDLIRIGQKALTEQRNP
ncbi:hypothetical protein UA08_05038 [Talaromyces atroroseus]|uniref:NAD(P)-binding domain-containing protein n=1 Tax=Talaromyces atroroseus TaxID=1441469 RepID=A0A225AEM9_TALAT|nr:hypothetical protein UA08_05038 [Talaromyces atroroseus]OKL59731.1 hypothetical protein UA08_05038 [Talaromyces atroroseus]